MKILLIGNGGREHAIAWKLAESPLVQQVLVAPGNPGTALEANIENLPISINDQENLLNAAIDNQVDLTIVGPEGPLAAGIVDYFQTHGQRCLGPSQKAATLEASKAFAKAFMQQNKIPTAKSQIFTKPVEALEYCKHHDYPLVIKADGLAAGKGVVIAENYATTEKAINNLGNTIVIEEFLKGEELSFIVLCDGEHYVPLASSCDHKARDDSDKGPNTGGMGAFSPAACMNQDLMDVILTQIIEPTLIGMKNSGTPYKGFFICWINAGT